MDKLKSFFKKEPKASGRRLGSAGDIQGSPPTRQLHRQLLAGPLHPAQASLSPAGAAQTSATSPGAGGKSWQRGTTANQSAASAMSSSQLPAAASSSQPEAGADPSEEVQSAVAVFLSQAEPESAAPQTLIRILHNICSQPDNPKFRSLKMSNAKIRASILETPGALDLLEACGFQMQLAGGSSEAAEGTLSLPMHCDLAECRATRQLLQTAMPSSPDATPQGAAPASASLPAQPTSSAAPAPAQHAQQGSSAPLPTQHTAAPGGPASSAAPGNEGPVAFLGPGPPTSSSANAAYSSDAHHMLPQALGCRNGASPAVPPLDMGSPAVPRLRPMPASSQAAEESAEDSVGQNPQSSGSSTIQVVEVQRNTQVLLPVELNAEVPEWIFERTGLELKRMWQAARKQREQDQMLMTRATRERLAQQRMGTAATRTPSSTSTIRVRFPNGLLLQGNFAAAEPVAMVEAWVADALADPLTPFNLILPTRQALQAGRGQTVKQADLMPAVTLSFQQVGEALSGPAGWGTHGSTQHALIRDELLRAARPAA
ncbi:hypothetical protein WJX74_008871 [Apatococcus lobatus]|uniref:UBX domain-containing protein n=1 Tax=Apatococcus lobatus TaxID=904363 RepID=A0AAW1SC56_9CHLO